MRDFFWAGGCCRFSDGFWGPDSAAGDAVLTCGLCRASRPPRDRTADSGVTSAAPAGAVDYPAATVRSTHAYSNAVCFQLS